MPAEIQSFSLSGTAVPTPFAIVRPGVPLRVPPGLNIRRVDPLSAADSAFCLAMNRANCLAYDGEHPRRPASELLGMPRWVFLDCCALPSVVFGMELPRDAVPAHFADVIDPTGECETLPVSEYIALPSLVAGEFIGVSLFSFLSSGSWGRRTKALALYSLGATTQVGVAQFSNPSIRLHLAFAPLFLLQASVQVHSRPDETFVYKAELPSPDEMLAMWSGERHTMHEGTLEDGDLVLAPSAVQAHAATLTGAWSIVHAEIGAAGVVEKVVFRKRT